RTEAVVRRMSDIALATTGVTHAIAFPGLSINGFVNSPNTGIAFIALKDFEDSERVEDRSAWEVLGELNAKFAQIQDAFIAVFPPPAIQGLGAIGGFKLQIEDRAGLGFETLYRETQSIIGQAWQTPGLADVFSAFQINV